jgi:hypothetical protein
MNMQDQTTGVHYCSQTNSTHFTDCCKTAVLDNQAKCPRCGRLVVPESRRGRHNMAMDRMYGRDRKRY